MIPGMMREPTDDDYRMQHRAPDRDSGAPLFDLTGNGIYPSDFYDRPDWYPAGHDSDGDALGIIYRVRGRPEARLWMYRAVPRGILTFNPGDWVAITKAYARDHGRHGSDPGLDMPVIAARVSAARLFTAGDSYQEWGYDGPPLEGHVVFRPRKPLTPEQRDARNAARRSAQRAAKRRAWSFYG